jgi:hypothetical protein
LNILLKVISDPALAIGETKVGGLRIVKELLPISLRSVGIALAILFGAFLLCEVPPVVAAICTLVVGVQTLTGVRLYQRYLGSATVTIFEYISIGFAIGAALSVLTALFLQPILNPSIGWVIPSIVVLARSKTDRDPPSRVQHGSTGIEWFGVVTISFLYLAQDSHWPTAVFVAGTCLFVAFNWRPKTIWVRASVLTVITAGFIGGIIASVYNRPPFWHYLTDDFRVFESLSRSIWDYGPQDEFGTLGTIGAQYHISTYAYSGLLDRLSGASTFIVLNRAMLILTALLLSTIVWAFLRRDGGKNRMINLGLAAMFPLFFDYSFTSPSYCFGLFFYLVGVFFWTDHQHRVRPWLQVFIGLLITAFIMTTKISNMPVVLSGLGVLALYALARKPSWTKSALINFITTLVTTGIYFFVYLANGRTSSQLESMYAFGYARRIAGDLVTISDPFTRITASLMYTSLYLVLPIVAVLYFFSLHRRLHPQLLIFVLPAVPIVLITALFGGADASGYFVLASLGVLNIALIVFLSKYLSDFNWRERHNQQIVGLALIAGLLGLLTHRMVAYFNGGTANEILIRSILQSHWVSALLLSLIAYGLFKLGQTKKKHPFWILFLVAEIMCFASIEVMLLDRLTKGTELTASESATAIGTTDEIAVGRWLRTNTDKSSLVATNHFCGPACSGADWFENDFLRLNDTYIFPASPTGYGTFNFILSNYAERRFLIEGARFLLVNGMSRKDVLERMNVALAFANESSKASFDSLQNFGVDYFVIDKQSTTQRNWGLTTSKLYENDTFIVLQVSD